MDDIERAAIAAEGYDPDDPAVDTAVARASALLAELGRRGRGYRRLTWTGDSMPTCGTPGPRGGNRSLRDGSSPTLAGGRPAVGGCRLARPASYA